MAEKEEVTVDQTLLQSNLGVMHDVYMQTIDELHSKLIVDATEAALRGEKFDPVGVELKITKCEDCENDEKKTDDNKTKSDNPRIIVAGLDPELIEGLMGVIEGTVKNKKPSMENLEKLVASLDELFKKKK